MNRKPHSEETKRKIGIKSALKHGREIGDWVGETHGRLTILSREGFDSSQKALVKVKCDCGNEKIIRRNNFLYKTQSCGCYKADHIRETMGKPASWVGSVQVFNHYKREASERNFSFILSKEEFKEIISKSCFYCGAMPSQKVIRYPSFVYNGVDRVNNSLGYQLDNTVPCCWRCNRMKHTLSVEEFIDHLRKIVSRFPED